MSCQVEQIADCGDISTIARALFIPEKEDVNWLSQCSVSLSSCGNLLAVGYLNRLCLLTTQWISSTDSNTYLISWSGTLPSDITAILAVPICPSQQSSHNGPDWFCVIAGFRNGYVGFYTNTGHLLLHEKFDEKPVNKISCHTGVYGTLPEDIHILYPTCECIMSGIGLFQTLRNAKAHLAKVQAGVQDGYQMDSHSIGIRKWVFTDQEIIDDAAVVGLELKNSYDHLLAASTYGGYDTWYRSIPPVNTLILGTGVTPYVGFHYALEGGTAPPLQDVARAVANKIKSALPGWLGGGSSESQTTNTEPSIKSENLSMRSGLYDAQRHGNTVCVCPDRRLAAIADSLGRVAVLDLHRGHIIRLFKGYRDAQCAFVQVFDSDNKKPQLSVVKEINRAVFLIIYNPKKGLIDIRSMQRGNRVAVFTATKNGKLIYNTCGLVGAEKNYTHKKLNLPEFECVLIDPDGKLKKFNIPFFYALDGENSDRSKDLHALRELRDFMKKTSYNSEDYEAELVAKASALKTLELKKHAIDIMVKKIEIPPKMIMSCIEIFWDDFDDSQLLLNEDVLKIKQYFANLVLVTAFYRHINNENTDDMKTLMSKVYNALGIQIEEDNESEEDTPDSDDFHLLEDDNCILERLLHLTQENNYKDQQHAKVKFADYNMNTFKDFVSCFALEGEFKNISLKPDTSNDKIDNLASDIFKAIFNIVELKQLTKFVKNSNVETKDIVKLVIMHVMNMRLENISIALIEKFIAVLYYLCSVSEDATKIVYNEISPWWQNIRELLVDMPCPLRSMIVAMACKSVGNIFENKSLEDEGAWVSVTKESAKWGILIGKLEDISLLSIILMFKDTFTGNALPKLDVSDININLKYIYTRGKGSVTELISKWLCGMGVVPEAIVANELMEAYTATNPSSEENEENDSTEYLFIQNNKFYVDDNPKIFKWLSLLCRQFPLSTSANYIIANMCWEYSVDWQKDTKRIANLNTVLRCLQNISNLHLRLGLFSIIWSTYLKYTFEATCQLINKVGRLPKDPLCLQDLGFSSTNMIHFLEFATKYLDGFMTCSILSREKEKVPIQLEKIWDESSPSLVEVVQETKNVNTDILNLNQQIACTLYFLCYFNVKCTKPLDSLYDVDFQYIIDALTGNVVTREINMKPSEKVRNPRLKFLTKLIRAAVETITCNDNTPLKTYNDVECNIWIENVTNLGEMWNVDADFIKRQQVIALYHMGYDTLTDNVLSILKDPAVVLIPILAITIQRLKQSQTYSPDKSEWIVTVPPHLFKRMQNTPLDLSIPAYTDYTTTMMVLQKLIAQIEKKTTKIDSDLQQNIKLAQVIIDTCEVLLRRKL